MSAQFACSACGQLISSDVSPGQQVRCPYCDAVVKVPTASAPPTVTLGAAPGLMGVAQPARTGLAVGALVCGIIGLAGCAPVGLVGVILGIVALSKISADPQEYGGKGYAIGGICTGGLGLILVPVIALLISVMVPSLTRARELSKRLVCAANLKGIGTSTMIYANDWNNQFPTGDFFQTLVDTGEVTEGQFICPSSGVTLVDIQDGDLHACYEVISEALGTKDGRNVVAYEKPGNHAGEGGNVLFADGRVEFVEPYSRVEQLIRETKQRLAEVRDWQSQPDASP